MIERAIDMAPAINRIAKEIQELNELGLSPRDWEILEEIALPLKAFCGVSKELYGEKYKTMPLAIPAFNLIMDDLKNLQVACSSMVIIEAIDIALNKLKTYYVKCENLIYAIEIF